MMELINIVLSLKFATKRFIRDINIKKWRYQCLLFAIADMIVGAVLVCVLIRVC